jgi:DNA (cytosine-5)-methyltransferase 1
VKVELTTGELFSGIGGMRCGLEKSGWKTVWANDNDRYACQIYRKNFGDKELVEADVKAIDPDSIPDFNLLTAGFPCQSFSMAGKRKGFQDVRGTLFHEIIRIASAKRPKLLLLENVKGLLSNDNGKTFGTILEELGRIGYWCEWQTLNSKHFGVPQNRNRVFIVGHLRGADTRQVFPVGEASQDFAEARDKTPGEGQRTPVANTLRSRYFKDGSENLILQWHTPDGLRQFEDIVPALTQWMGTGGGNVPMAIIFNESINGETFPMVELCPTLRGPKAINNLKLATAKALTGGGHSGGLHSQTMLIANTITDGWLLKPGHKGWSGQSAMRIRRLTPVECERLQGFPDRWTEHGLTTEGEEVVISDTQKYRCLGNAVTTNVISFLGQKLRECLC